MRIALASIFAVLMLSSPLHADLHITSGEVGQFSDFGLFDVFTDQFGIGTAIHAHIPGGLFDYLQVGQKSWGWGLTTSTSSLAFPYL